MECYLKNRDSVLEKRRARHAANSIAINKTRRFEYHINKNKEANIIKKAEDKCRCETCGRFFGRSYLPRHILKRHVPLCVDIENYM
jgi:hypothetical protein